MGSVVQLPRAAAQPVENPHVRRRSLPDGVVPIRPPIRQLPSPGPHATLLNAIVQALPRKRQMAVMADLRKKAAAGCQHADVAINYAQGFYGWTR